MRRIVKRRTSALLWALILCFASLSQIADAEGLNGITVSLPAGMTYYTTGDMLVGTIDASPVSEWPDGQWMAESLLVLPFDVGQPYAPSLLLPLAEAFEREMIITLSNYLNQWQAGEREARMIRPGTFLYSIPQDTPGLSTSPMEELTLSREGQADLRFVRHTGRYGYALEGENRAPEYTLTCWLYLYPIEEMQYFFCYVQPVFTQEALQAADTRAAALFSSVRMAPG